MTSRPSTIGRLATIALAVFAILALTLGAYTAAYLWLGKNVSIELIDPDTGREVMEVERIYSDYRLREFFSLAGRLDATLSSRFIRLSTPSVGTTLFFPTQYRKPLREKWRYLQK